MSHRFETGRIHPMPINFGSAPGLRPGHGIVANPTPNPHRLSAKPCDHPEVNGFPLDLVLTAHLAGLAVATGMILGLTAIVAFSLKHLA
jgi:hypothetical protein